MSALKKVLVVDDDPVVGKSFDRVLCEEKGYVVMTAHNAAEALEKLREQEYDLVFTDIRMPGIDGIELTERVKANRPWTPVVIVTGYGSARNQERARIAGASAVLNKPLSPEMIEQSTVSALRPPIPVIVVQPLAEPQAPAQVVAPIEVQAQRNALTATLLWAAAPFIGLIFALALPLVGTMMLLWLGTKAFVKSEAAKRAPVFLKNVALFFAAPFIGLGYAVMLPVIGVAMLGWTAGRALVRLPSVRQGLGSTKRVAAMLAVPFVGLAYALLLPPVGILILGWLAIQALTMPAKAK